jgi:hypothetical protein
MYSVPCAILVIPASAALCCGQQWSAVVLHPPGGWLSEAYAVTATRQGGVFVPPEPGEAQAGMWQGSPASWVPLSPPQWSAEVRGMDEWSQVGNLFGAVLWRGTPESRVDLQPAGATNSGAGAVRGNIQVGAVRVQPDIWHAALWHGSPESFVDLHPPGARSSTAGATDGVLQGGSSHWQVGSLNWARATIWNGTAESFVVLGPADFASVVNGMAPGVQVGHVLFPGQGYRAFVWHGTAESAMNMHPPGQGGGTRFFATSGRVHVGTMTQGGASRAAVNFGAPDAWLGLHQFLPASFAGFSGAHAVHQQGNTLFIAGYAEDGITREQAILCIGKVPPQFCYANCNQSISTPVLNVEDFACFVNQFSAGYLLPHHQQLGHYANCDRSTTPPALNVEDFACFIREFAQGCD